MHTFCEELQLLCIFLWHTMVGLGVRNYCRSTAFCSIFHSIKTAFKHFLFYLTGLKHSSKINTIFNYIRIKLLQLPFYYLIKSFKAKSPSGWTQFNVLSLGLSHFTKHSFLKSALAYIKIHMLLQHSPGHLRVCYSLRRAWWICPLHFWSTFI